RAKGRPRRRQRLRHESGRPRHSLPPRHRRQRHDIGLPLGHRPQEPPPRARTHARGHGVDDAPRIASATGMTHLPLPPSFDFDWMRRFLLLRRVPSLETWSDDGYVRSLWIDGVAARLTIVHRPADASSEARLDATSAPAMPGKTVRAVVTRMF